MMLFWRGIGNDYFGGGVICVGEVDIVSWRVIGRGDIVNRRIEVMDVLFILVLIKVKWVVVGIGGMKFFEYRFDYCFVVWFG